MSITWCCVIAARTNHVQSAYQGARKETFGLLRGPAGGHADPPLQIYARHLIIFEAKNFLDGKEGADGLAAFARRICAGIHIIFVFRIIIRVI